MSRRLPHELLTELRTYLSHFDQTGHLGEGATVTEIKRRLRERITEVEAEIARDTRNLEPRNGRAPKDHREQFG